MWRYPNIMERFTITRTQRWGNTDSHINSVYSAFRSKVKKDDVIRMANEMIAKDALTLEKTTNKIQDLLT